MQHVPQGAPWGLADDGLRRLQPLLNAHQDPRHRGYTARRSPGPHCAQHGRGSAGTEGAELTPGSSPQCDVPAEGERESAGARGEEAPRTGAWSSRGRQAPRRTLGLRGQGGSKMLFQLTCPAGRSRVTPRVLVAKTAWFHFQHRAMKRRQLTACSPFSELVLSSA